MSYVLSRRRRHRDGGLRTMDSVAFGRPRHYRWCWDSTLLTWMLVAYWDPQYSWSRSPFVPNANRGFFVSENFKNPGVLL